MTAPRLGCGVVVLRAGRVLLIQRRRDPEAGCWGLPGGKIDWMEPAATAAARELLEETGVIAGPLTLLCAADHIDPDAGEHWLAPVYLAREAAGEPVLLEPEKHAALGWFDPADPPAPLTITARAALGGAALTVTLGLVPRAHRSGVGQITFLPRRRSFTGNDPGGAAMGPRDRPEGDG